MSIQRICKKTTRHDKRCEKSRKIDAKELIKNFFDPSSMLYLDIEMIMHAITGSCVKQSCESILASLVSKYERNFHSRRNVNEDSYNEESVISVNGPNIAHCHQVIGEPIDRYRKGGKDDITFL